MRFVTIVYVFKTKPSIGNPMKVEVFFNSLGTPDTRRSGRSTRKALRALTSNPPDFPAWACAAGGAPVSFSPSLVKTSKTTLNNLQKNQYERMKKCVETCRKKTKAMLRYYGEVPCEVHMNEALYKYDDLK